MKIIFYIIPILFLFNCHSEKSFIIINDSMNDVINDYSRSKELNIGFRKSTDSGIILYVFEVGVRSCEAYYGTNVIKDKKLHLFLHDGIQNVELRHLIEFVNPTTCVLSIKDKERVYAPDELMLYEYAFIDNEFVKISAW